MCEAIISYAKDELSMDALQALVCEDNHTSVALLQRLGFKYHENVTEGGNDYQLWIRNLIGE